MITTLDINGFKSVKEVHLDCRRINVFIGEPNAGKSNILEALGFLSFCGREGNLLDYVRLGQMRDLFYDGFVAKGAWRLKLETRGQTMQVSAELEKGAYLFHFHFGSRADTFIRAHQSPQSVSLQPLKEMEMIRFYRFKTLATYPSDEGEVLLPPDGPNLVALLNARRPLRQMAGEYFEPSGFVFVIKPHERLIELQKQADGVAVGIPYLLASDTLQRMVFYSVAIESNKESVLIFEEPESHAFPYYTKHLGERIATDENKNQYFIATHNPYLLAALVEKTPKGDLAVFATYYRDFETKARLLTPEEIQRLHEGDPFLGVEHLLEDGA